MAQKPLSASDWDTAKPVTQSDWDSATPVTTAATPTSAEGGGFLGGVKDLAIGAAKGVGGMVATLGSKVHKLPGVSTAVDALYGTPGLSQAAFQEAEQSATPANTMQSIGKLAADIGTAIIPGGAVTSTSRAAAALAPRLMRPLVRGAGEATGAAGIASAQGESPTGAALAGGAFGAISGRTIGKLVNPNVAEREAVEFGMRRGIPVSAGAATGNTVVKGAEYIADRSLVGSMISGGARQAEADALKRVGGDLAASVSPHATTPYQAGQAVLDAVEGRIREHSDEANTAYRTLRNIEADPALTETVKVKIPMKDSAGVTTMETRAVKMQMPVDLRSSKAALRPIYDRMTRQMPVAQQRADPALHAIKNVLDSTDYMPASVIDMDLSAIKALARTDAATRSVSQGIASSAVHVLDSAVRQAVKKGGPKAEAALVAGRTATQAKYLADDILKQLRDEPRQVFDQAVWAKDAGVDRLSELAKLAPKEMPRIGRAYLDELLTKATADGGFMKSGTLAESWKNLGPRSKQLLFRDPNLVRELDSFFLLAKKMAESPNPSGTAQIGGMMAQGAQAVYDPLTAIVAQTGLAGLSKLLHSRTGVKLLTEGIRLPTLGPKMQQALANAAGHVVGGQQRLQTNP